jgi:hypothetical protein
MIDVILNVSKVSIKSIFTADKYNAEILDDDLHRILFIRHVVEESSDHVKYNHKDLDAELYARKLKEYALELFLQQCEEARAEEGNDNENHVLEDREYFNYIYDNLAYPD